MKLCEQRSAPLGDVVATVFDQAECCATNPLEVARLASFAVMRLWVRSTLPDVAGPFPGVGEQGPQ